MHVEVPNKNTAEEDTLRIKNLAIQIINNMTTITDPDLLQELLTLIDFSSWTKDLKFPFFVSSSVEKYLSNIFPNLNFLELKLLLSFFEGNKDCPFNGCPRLIISEMLKNLVEFD